MHQQTIAYQICGTFFRQEPQRSQEACKERQMDPRKFLSVAGTAELRVSCPFEAGVPRNVEGLRNPLYCPTAGSRSHRGVLTFSFTSRT